MESGLLSLFYIARLCHVTYLYFCIQIFESIKYTEHAASLVRLVTLPGRFVVVGHCATQLKMHKQKATDPSLQCAAGHDVIGNLRILQMLEEWLEPLGLTKHRIQKYFDDWQ